VTRILAILNAISAITLLTVATVWPEVPAHPVWVFLAGGNAVAALYLWVAHRRERAAKSAPTLWPDGDDLPTWSYRQLVAKHDEGQRLTNQGDPAAPGDEALHAIEEELRRRGVPLCGCGAAPGGVHLTNCPEKP